jgi:dsRNA-specific ribonuclease
VDAPFIGEGKSRREAEQAAADAALENVLNG